VELLVEPLLVAVSFTAVMLAAAWVQHREFRRTGDPPLTTVRGALVYGAGSFLSSLVAQVWNPPTWQKVVLVGAVLLLLVLVRRHWRGRLPPTLARHLEPRVPSLGPPRPAYRHGVALARRVRRLLGRE